MEGDLLGLANAPTPRGAPAGPSGDDPISNLRTMFPAVDESVIETVYNDVVGGDLEKAIEALLQITDDSVDVAAAASTEQAMADELLALQMLQQMMNEEDVAKADADKVFRRIQQDVEKKEAFKNQTKGEKRAARHAARSLPHRACARAGSSLVRRDIGRLADRRADDAR
jgi:DNA polymerase III gamma/tau subunit